MPLLQLRRQVVLDFQPIRSNRNSVSHWSVVKSFNSRLVRAASPTSSILLPNNFQPSTNEPLGLLET